MWFRGFLLLALISINSAQVYPQPEQVHLSIGNNVDEMVVTWVTLSPTNETIVQYGVGSSFSYTVEGKQSLFVDGGSLKRKIYMHRASMSGLSHLVRYIYRVGSSQGWSPIFNFRTLPGGSDWAPRFAMLGDMGNKNARSMGRLQEGAQLGEFDVVLHVGDFAYDFHTNDAKVGDEYMRQVETFAAFVPYMTCPGNHEASYNFSNYKARFSMPGGDDVGEFYSFNVGPMHLIFFSSEFYYFTDFGKQQIISQYNWLKNDLEEANKPENRAARPWIIAMGHRPMYCSNKNDPIHCSDFENLVRVGYPFSNQSNLNQYMFGLEELFYRYGVDIIVGAHEHSYERMLPVYNWTVCPGVKGTYIDPPAPIHIVSGSAGNQEGESPFMTNEQPWSAYHSMDYGYTRFQVFNATSLYLEQYSDDKNSVVDRMWIQKAKHGPGLYTCHMGKPYKYRDGHFIKET